MKTDPTERDQQIAREKAHEFLGAYHPNTEGRKRELESIILAAIQDAKQQGNETPTVILGFASWKDGSFELIVRDDEQGEETTLKGRLEQGQFEQVSKILPTCVFVPARCQQGNEDTARLSENWRRRITKYKEQGTNRYGQGYIAAMEACAIQLDRARGVQPAAKETQPTVQVIGEDFVVTPAAKSKYATEPPEWLTQQESAPAAEQRVKVLFDGLNLIRSRALLDGHTEFYRIADEAIDASRAPSPAQDKPVAANLRRVVKDALIDAQNQIIGFARERNPKVEQALELLSSSPSEQKSSLPSETRSAQEQERQETGNI